MLSKLLKKEFTLCLHPAAILMIGLSALTMVPNYPYCIMYFYMTLGVFFICLDGRENHDVIYTLTLPVAKNDVVTARILMTVVLELTQMLLALVFVFLHSRLAPGANAAGMDANIALLGEGFLYFGLYHLVFFTSYYKDVSRVGTSFVKSCVFSGLFVIAEIVACYTVPLFRDVLDTPDPAHIGSKLAFVGVCALCFLLCTYASLRISQKCFEKLDIR